MLILTISQMIMNKFLKYFLYVGVAVGIAFFCFMLCVSKPSYKFRPVGDSWENCEECPYCDGTGYSSWHFFGLINEKCVKCFGLGWMTEVRYKKLIRGAGLEKTEEENIDADDDNLYQTDGQINPITEHSSPSTTYEDPISTSTMRTCPYCNGSGQGNDEIIYAPNYTGEDNSTYCAECGSTGSAHSHVHHTCQTCLGKGYIE